ncbi:MAG TPA: thiamine-phosphate kinase [Phycisphaerae bacterium]|nr:thiamine-phosphate kinase [Phycisphaerae bacterium]
MSRGENALVRWLQGRFEVRSDRIEVGIGDDAAVLRLGGACVAITTDMLLDGVHFDARVHTYEQIGRKAIACSLSDCAAKACHPRAATVSIALNDAMTLTDVQRLYEGMAVLADEFDCPIVGGDTTSWTSPLVIDVAMLAEPMSPRGPVLRSGARVGDAIFVSGPLGGSLLGKHLTFAPRLDLSARLAAEPALHAMMDISDGLSMDLDRLCLASGCGAELNADLLKSVISEDARAMARQDGRSPLDHALNDGEDYELLVVGEASLGRSGLGLLPVGRVVSPRHDMPTMILAFSDGRREPIEPKGFEHFR